MTRFVLLAAVVVFVMCVVVTQMVRRFALSHGVMDIPNERSSHTTATPRGGGLSIALTCTAALVVFGALRTVDGGLVMALVGGGSVVAAIGFLDDRRPVPTVLRLLVHVVAAVWAVAWLGGLPPIRVGELVFTLGWLGSVLGVLGIVWALNLFNFMDGIDGIAVSEAVFIAGGAVVLSLPGGLTGVPAVACILCAACAGFLVWNWPPAKIFMGDVGSGYLGYMIAVLALAATRDNPVSVWVWLILGGAFFVDATVTLTRRSLRKERLLQAHRSHAYQRLARRWASHRRVTLSFLVVNLFWLLPAAWLAGRHPQLALWSLTGAFVPLMVLAIAAGAGLSEEGGR